MRFPTMGISLSSARLRLFGSNPASSICCLAVRSAVFRSGYCPTNMIICRILFGLTKRKAKTFTRSGKCNLPGKI